MSKNMMNKILTLTFLMCALCVIGFSQDTMDKKMDDKKMSDKKMDDKKDEMKMSDGKFVSSADAAKNALNVGAKMPEFSLKDSTGKTVASDDLLKDGNLVLVFYRGAWCPFCNAYLKKLQKNMPQIQSVGGRVVAVSVENPDNSSAVAKKNEVEFTVLSDPGLAVARQFGIVYELPKETSELYKSKGLDLAKYNNLDKAELPLSATYVINKKGEIVYAFLEPDYKKRAEPEAIIDALSKIKSADTMK